MSTELIVALTLFVLIWGSSLGTLAWISIRQSREITRLSGAILRNQLAGMALTASKETGTMLGPAVLQQMQHQEEFQEPPETEKRTGVSLQYDHP